MFYHVLTIVIFQQGIHVDWYTINWLIHVKQFTWNTPENVHQKSTWEMQRGLHMKEQDYISPGAPAPN